MERQLGPDSSEEDTTPFDRTIEVTVKMQRTFKTCNAGLHEDENRVLNEVNFDLEAAGYSKVDIVNHQVIDDI